VGGRSRESHSQEKVESRKEEEGGRQQRSAVVLLSSWLLLVGTPRLLVGGPYAVA
jgi:hypothetical protein